MIEWVESSEEDFVLDFEITGQWDELVQREDLRGHRVKVIVMDEPTRPGPSTDEWLKALRRMVANGVRTGQDVDTSRESIYTGTLDDTR